MHINPRQTNLNQQLVAQLFAEKISELPIKEEVKKHDKHIRRKQRSKAARRRPYKWQRSRVHAWVSSINLFS